MPTTALDFDKWRTDRLTADMVGTGLVQVVRGEPRTGAYADDASNWLESCEEGLPPLRRGAGDPRAATQLNNSVR